MNSTNVRRFREAIDTIKRARKYISTDRLRAADYALSTAQAELNVVLKDIDAANVKTQRTLFGLPVVIDETINPHQPFIYSSADLQAAYDKLRAHLDAPFVNNPIPPPSVQRGLLTPDGIARKGDAQYFNSFTRNINNLLLTRNPKLDFRDISDQVYREYGYRNDEGESVVVLRVDGPIAVAIDKYGHRIVDAQGRTTYIARYQFTYFTWKSRAGAPACAW